jgi:iron complex transport system substrate-binding protein
MLSSARSRRLPRLLLGSLVVVVVALTGCSASAGGSGSGSGEATCAPSTTPLAQLAVDPKPRDVVGESTACLTDTAIDPVADDVVPQLPATVTDNQGTQVTITDTSRILALDLYGSLAATVFGLGLGDNVVGRDTSTGFEQAKDLPLVTQNGHELNGEAILALAPTVILTDSSIGPWDVVLQMRESGIPVVVMTPTRSLENTGDIVTAVAAALGVPEQGRMLTERLEDETTQTVADIAAIAPKVEADKLRIMFLYVRGNAGIYYIFGTGSGTDSLITSLGGIDVATEIGWQGMRPMTAEAMVDASPDLILMMTRGLESVDGVDGLLERIPAVAETPAGQHRRIVDMSDTEVLSFGPRSPAVLEALARAIYAPAKAE